MSGTLRTRIITEYRTPIEALQLNEDINALEQCRKMLDRVNPGNISRERELGRRIIQVTQSQLRICERIARSKLAREFIAPRTRKHLREHGHK